MRVLRLHWSREDGCARAGFQRSRSSGFYFRWKAKFGGLDVTEARRLRELEEENRRLKHAVADLTLGQADSQGSAVKKMLTPAARREAISWSREEHQASERRACGLASCARSMARYQPSRDGQEDLRARLRELAAKKPRYGYRRLTALLRRSGEQVNPKRVHRLYRLEGLAVRRKKRKRLAGG